MCGAHRKSITRGALNVAVAPVFSNFNRTVATQAREKLGFSIHMSQHMSQRVVVFGIVTRLKLALGATRPAGV